MNRRGFLKLTGGAIAAAIAAPAIEKVTAPLFIPAERLEMGVPKPIATPETATIYLPLPNWGEDVPAVRFRGEDTTSTWATITETEPTLVINRLSYAVFEVDGEPGFTEGWFRTKDLTERRVEWGYVDPVPRLDPAMIALLMNDPRPLPFAPKVWRVGNS